MQHEHVARTDAAEHGVLVVGPPRQAHPKHVDRRADVLHRQSRAVAQLGVATVGDKKGACVVQECRSANAKVVPLHEAAESSADL